MFRLRLALATAGFAAISGSALAHPGHPAHGSGPATLPDFPPNAESGGCYARVPIGEGRFDNAGAGPDVWTVRRGAGPTAVWSYSQGEGGAAMDGTGPLAWARVDCDSGRPVEGMPYAGVDRAPETMPPSPMMPMPYAETPAPMDAMPGDPLGRYADPRPAMPPPPHGMAPAEFAGPAPHGPMRFVIRRMGPAQPPMIASRPDAPRPMEFAPEGPPPAAPWFGGRMLSWPGKTR